VGRKGWGAHVVVGERNQLRGWECGAAESSRRYWKLRRND
jgi:hypothetical protein